MGHRHSISIELIRATVLGMLVLEVSSKTLQTRIYVLTIHRRIKADDLSAEVMAKRGAFLEFDCVYIASVCITEGTLPCHGVYTKGHSHAANRTAPRKAFPQGERFSCV